MGWWSRSEVVVLSLALLTAAPAFAQSDEAKARSLAKDAAKAYNLSEFRRALELYSDAYKLKQAPGLLFNLGQCHRQLGEYERAAFFYDRFIDTSPPKAPNVAVAKGLLAEMQAKQQQQDAADAEARRKKLDEQKAQDELKAVQLTPQEPAVAPTPAFTAPPVVEAEPPVYKKGWFWAVIAVGVVVVAGATTTAVVLGQPKPATPSLGEIPR